MLFPNHETTARNFKCLVINKKDGNCNSFKGQDQVDFQSKIVCLDPIYNVLWSYEAANHQVCCYNIIAAELQSDQDGIERKTRLSRDSRVLSEMKVVQDKGLMDKYASLNVILSPELALPVTAGCHVTR